MPLRTEDFDDLCPNCGGVIDRSKPHSIKRIFCSFECGVADYRKAERDARIEEKRSRPPCLYCGATIPAVAPSHRKYCGRSCQQHAVHTMKRLRFPGKCQNCGAGFHGHNAAQIYCSKWCAAKSYRRRSNN